MALQQGQEITSRAPLYHADQWLHFWFHSS